MEHQVSSGAFTFCMRVHNMCVVCIFVVKLQINALRMVITSAEYGSTG